MQDGTVIDVVLAEGTDPSEALQAGFGGSGQSGAMLQQSGNKCTLVNGSGTMNLSYAVRIGPQTYGQGNYTVNFTTAGLSSGGESGSEDEEGGEEPSTGTELTVDNKTQYTTVDIIDQPLGSGNVTTLTIYLQSSFAKVNVDKATQDGNVINLVLAESTDLSAAIQLAVSGSGLGMPQSHSGNKVTLANGKANTEYTYSAGGNSVTYTVNLIVKGAESGEEELPARREEIEHAKEEGVIFNLLNNPVEILGDENGNVCGVKVIKMKLGEPDQSGRRKPIELQGSEFVIDADTVIMAIGTCSNPLISNSTSGLQTNYKKCLLVDERLMTTKDGVFAGGDAVTGSATVILAMGAGKKATKSIDEYLKNKLNI